MNKLCHSGYMHVTLFSLQWIHNLIEESLLIFMPFQIIFNRLAIAFS